jgi:hypothetical protein
VQSGRRRGLGASDASAAAMTVFADDGPPE